MEKIAFVKFLGRFLGPMSGLSEKQTLLNVAEYGEEIFQLKYNWGYRALRTRVAQEKKIAHNDDLRILQKVAAMTVTEDTK